MERDKIMLTGILSLAVGYLGVEGIAFTAAKFLKKPVGELAVNAHKSGEHHRDVVWLLSKILKSKLTTKERERYDMIAGFYKSDAATMNLRSGV